MISYARLTVLMALIVQTVYQIVNYTRVVSYFLYIPYIAVILLIMVSGGKIKIPSGYRYLFSGIVLCYLLGPMLGGNINYSSYTYTALVVMFSLAVIQMGKSLSSDISNIKKMAYIGALFLIYLVLTHLNAFSLSNMYDALGIGGVRNTSVRESFGFWHPNAAGYMFGTEIILLSFAMTLEDRMYKKVIECGLIIIFTLSMLASGCRTAAITIVVYFSIKFVLKNTRVFKRARPGVLLVIIIAFCFYFSSVNGFEGLLQVSSGRNMAVVNVIDYLWKSGRLLFGYGATRISEGNIGITIDNWYLNVLAYYGVCGFFFILLGVVSLLVSLYSTIRLLPDESIKENIISFIIMFFLYGLCENVIYVPGVTLCGVFWIVMNMFYFYVSNNYLEE